MELLEIYNLIILLVTIGASAALYFTLSALERWAQRIEKKKARTE